jgi:hypothetical protein
MLNALEATRPSDKVSGKYAFISSAQFIKDMQVNGWELKNTINRSRTGKGKHAMRFRNPAHILPNGDFLDIVVLNSHDGTCSFTLSLGIYRLVCSNGLVVGKDLVEPQRIRHVGYAERKVKTAIEVLLSQASRIAEIVERLQARVLTIEEYTAFCNTALQVRNLEPHKVTVEQFHTPLREADKGMSAWAVLNRVQESVVRGFDVVNLETHRIKRIRALKGAKPEIEANKKLFDAITKLVA